MPAAQLVAAINIGTEQAVYSGMIDRLLAIVDLQVLLADISDVAAFAIFREQMVKRLIAVGSDLLGNCVIPFFAVGEDRVYVKDHAAKIEKPMSDNISYAEACMSDNRSVKFGAIRGRNVRVHRSNLERLCIDTRRVLGKGEIIR